MSAQQNNGKGSQRSETLRVLAVADLVEPQLYNSSITRWLPPIDLLISCGDLPPGYLDFLVSNLNAPLVHVLGNHCYVSHDSVSGKCEHGSYPGAHNLHGEVAQYSGLILAGVEGSPIYNNGPHQYSEQHATWNMWRMAPKLLLNKMNVGRYLDVLVTHTPPRGIHDNEDLAHKGFASLLPFIERFKPTLLLHGHTHRYNPLLPTRTKHGETEIINAYGHVLLELTRDNIRDGWRVVSSKQGEVSNAK
ncbi:MAG TPA: metallophosphoesterase [Chloroflexia bacterium]|nr:metallophosphoesterase [Chloroflexia bacterium]